MATVRLRCNYSVTRRGTMASWLLIVIVGCWVGTSVRSETYDEKCLFSYSGMLTNITLWPNPPRYKSVEHVHADLLFTRSVEVLTVTGYVKNEKTGFILPFLASVCDLSVSFCPIYKGEKRSIDFQQYVTSAWEANVPSSVVAKLLDENEGIIAEVSVKNCTLVNPKGQLKSKQMVTRIILIYT
ncbi:uncharacterized protein [Apostichopus japonicus]|uniref:uncharacterized protein n=1 Tax=Stichopus japonicus TaxID=307972 RepID=UPI003AB22E90